MSRPTSRSIGSLLVGALVAGACGSGPGSAPSPGTTAPAGPTPTATVSRTASPAADSAAPPVFPLAAYPGWVAYSSSTPDDRGFVAILRTDVTEEHEIATDVVDETPGGVDRRKHPEWSPDGTRIVFERWRMPANVVDLFEYDLASDTSRELIHCDDLCAQVSDASYAPDGAHLIYYYAEGPTDPNLIPADCGLRILDIATGNTTTVSDHPCGVTEEIAARWSPDGRRLAFVRTQQMIKGGPVTESSVIVRDLATRRETILAKRPGLAGSLDWSPDGTRIIYTAADRTLHEVAPDGSGGRVLVDLATQDTGYDSKADRIDHPRYTPDGAWIMFGIWQDDSVKPVRRELWAVPAGGGTIQEVFPKGTSTKNNMGSHFPWASLQPVP